MDEKPGKGKIAAFIAAVLLATGAIAWALYESFSGDSNRFEDFNESYYGDEYDQQEPEVSTDESTPPAKP